MARRSSSLSTTLARTPRVVARPRRGADAQASAGIALLLSGAILPKPLRLPTNEKCFEIARAPGVSAWPTACRGSAGTLPAPDGALVELTGVGGFAVLGRSLPTPSPAASGVALAEVDGRRRELSSHVRPLPRTTS